MNVLLADDSDSGWFEARLLQEFGISNEYLSPEKIAELWKEFSKHDVLFTDYTEGKFEPFLLNLMNPRAIWVEIFNVEEQKPVGVMMMTNIILGFDCEGHFAVWDSKARGKEGICLKMMEFCFNRYNLHRMTAKIVPYMKGTIRFAKRLGFIEEGEMREAVVRSGEWFSLKMFGITRSELEEKLWEQWPHRSQLEDLENSLVAG